MGKFFLDALILFLFVGAAFYFLKWSIMWAIHKVVSHYDNAGE